MCGAGNHSTSSDGHDNDLGYRGKYASELYITLMLVSTSPYCPVPSGKATLSKKTLTMHGVTMMKWLNEYEAYRILHKQPLHQLSGMPGRHVREFIIDILFCVYCSMLKMGSFDYHLISW